VSDGAALDGPDTLNNAPAKTTTPALAIIFRM
jgi:hypothetical protein